MELRVILTKNCLILRQILVPNCLGYPWQLPFEESISAFNLGVDTLHMGVQFLPLENVEILIIGIGSRVDALLIMLF
jgi:hypothetical protein